MNIERSILIVLDRVHPYVLPELTILSDLNLMLAEPVTLTPLRKAIASLEAKRQLVSVPSEDRGTLFKITATGQARLAE